MKKLSLCLLLLASQILIGQEALKFNQNDYVWNLSEIYSNDDTWNEDYSQVLKSIQNTNFSNIGVFSNSDQLLTTLNQILELREKTSRVAFYAVLRWEEGKVDNALDFLEKGESLLISFEAILSELEGKILAVKREQLIDWLETNKALRKHRHWLNQIIDQKDHRSTPEAEFALRKTRNWISSSIDTYWNLQSLDGIWPKIQIENNKEVSLNRSALLKIRRYENHVLRDSLAKKYYEALDGLKGIMGDLYVKKIKSELDLAKLRGFSDGINANWFFYTGSPPNTYRTILTVAKKNKNLLQRYVRLRGQLMDKEIINYLDFFSSPTLLGDYKYDFQKSMNIAFEASKQVSDEFHQNMNFVLNHKNWMHLADIPKNARYHIRPPVTGIHPYLILKYKPELTESRALVGGLFSLASDVESLEKDGIDIFETEAPVHISGTIYAGDIYFDKLTAQKSVNKEERIGHLLQSMEFLRRFFKNAILMELDFRVQNLVIEDEEVNGDMISKIFHELLLEYYGDDKELMNIPNYLANDWMTETPVLFMPKYEHHFWAPSLAVGAAMATDSNYNGLFKSPYDFDRYDSYSVLKNNQLEIDKESSYKPLLDLMNNIMDEIEELMNG